MPRTTGGSEPDENAREDLARWQHYVETGEAIPHEDVMAWLDALARSLRRRTQRSEVLRRRVMEWGGWAETPSRRGVSGRYRG